MSSFNFVPFNALKSHLSLAKPVGDNVEDTVEGQLGEEPVSPVLHLLHHQVKVFELAALAVRLEVSEELLQRVNSARSHDPLIVQLGNRFSNPKVFLIIFGRIESLQSELTFHISLKQLTLSSSFSLHHRQHQ